MNYSRSATSRASSIDSMQLRSSMSSRNGRLTENEYAGGIQVITREDYQRIKILAKIEPKEQKFEQERKLIMEKEEKQLEFENLILKNTQLRNTCNKSEMTEEQLEQNKTLCEKLKHIRQEEEEEIKKLNQIIVEAKCLAEREKQICEKQQQVKDLKKMERELDRRVALHQQQIDKKVQQLERERRQARARYATLIKQQIKENSNVKKISQEGLKEWEAKEINRQVHTFVLDKTQEKQQYLEKQLQLKEGLEKCIETKTKLKDIEKEAELRRIQKLTQERMAREEFEARVKEERKSKDKLRQIRSAYVSQLWHEGKDRLGEMEEFYIRKARETMDREWRERELQKARESAELKERIRTGRERQLSQKQRNKEDDEAREKIILDQIVRADNEATLKDMQKQEKRELERLRYSSEIRKQISENEEKNKHMKETQMKEAENYRRNVTEKQKMINHLKAIKLQELKDLKIPEKYVKEVARKTRIPWEEQ